MSRKNHIWTRLSELATSSSKISIGRLTNDPERLSRFSVDCSGLYLDFSRHLIDLEIFEALLELARETDIKKALQNMIQGAKVNQSESRSARHMTLRLNEPKDHLQKKCDEEKQRMAALSEAIRSGKWKSCTGKNFTDIINIGIGGSDLGPRMVSAALQEYANGPRLHFISNPDGAGILSLLNSLDPERTLVILSSKSFETAETMLNAEIVIEWLSKNLDIEDPISTQHCIAVTSQKRKALDYGIPSEQILTLDESIGGRYSIWSTIGLPICISIGIKKFQEFLDGGALMDKHFIEAEYEQNMPILLALIGIWYNNFLGCQSYAVIPYFQRLSIFIDYVQQLDMESSGKTAYLDSISTKMDTGPIVWGKPGTASQHAFFQLLHQGQKKIPVDFIAVKKDNMSPEKHNKFLLSNLVSQAEILANGENHDKQHLNYPGDQPSSVIVLDELTPRNLGMLVALYEHKIFTQAAIWNINPFDQWGVEHGKILAQEILDGVKSQSRSATKLKEKLGLDNH